MFLPLMIIISSASPLVCYAQGAEICLGGQKFFSRSMVAILPGMKIVLPLKSKKMESAPDEKKP